MKRLLILMVVLGWAIIAYLFLHTNSLKRENDRLNNNILSLVESNENMAIAYQTDYNQFCAERDSLRRMIGVSKKTQEVITHTVTVKSTDTLLIPIEDTILVKDFALDTTLVNDWRTTRITIEPNEGVLRLSDELSVQSRLSYRIDKKKVLKRKYRTWFGNKVWGPVFGKKTTVRTVTLVQDNPLIELNGDIEYIQIVD